MAASANGREGGNPAFHVDGGADVENSTGGSGAPGIAAWASTLPSAPPQPLPAASLYTNAGLLNTVLGLVLAALLGEQARYAVIALTLCINGLIFSKYLSDWLLSKDDGTADMRAVSEPIREGAQAFLRVQYGAIARMAVIVAFIIFLSYQMRPTGMSGGISSISSITLGVVGALSFVVGALCSAAAGYVSMHIAAQTNIRVASAARRGYQEALAICFRGGAFSAILVLAMCVSGVTVLHAFLFAVFADDFVPGSKVGVTPGDVPMLCVGYGFGASFVALFMQLGGGIYTKVRVCGWRAGSALGKADSVYLTMYLTTSITCMRIIRYNHSAHRLLTSVPTWLAR